jgi:hypothetical protein
MERRNCYSSLTTETDEIVNRDDEFSDRLEGSEQNVTGCG